MEEPRQAARLCSRISGQLSTLFGTAWLKEINDELAKWDKVKKDLTRNMELGERRDVFFIFCLSEIELACILSAAALQGKTHRTKVRPQQGMWARGGKTILQGLKPE